MSQSGQYLDRELLDYFCNFYLFRMSVGDLIVELVQLKLNEVPTRRDLMNKVQG
jgi:hypothetical protein